MGGEGGPTLPPSKQSKLGKKIRGGGMCVFSLDFKIILSKVEKEMLSHSVESLQGYPLSVSVYVCSKYISYKYRLDHRLSMSKGFSASSGLYI